MRHLSGIVLVSAVLAFPAFAAESTATKGDGSSKRLKEISPSELKIAPAKPGVSEPKQKKSARPPVKPAPGAASTPEEAAARAADRKDPSGALIIREPVGAGAKP